MWSNCVQETGGYNQHACTPLHIYEVKVLAEIYCHCTRVGKRFTEYTTSTLSTSNNSSTYSLVFRTGKLFNVSPLFLLGWF